MANLKPALVYLLQSVIVGLAAAFIVVLLRPDLLPSVEGSADSAPSSYAEAVQLSAPAVAAVYTKRLVQESSAPARDSRFRINTSFGSAVVIDPQGYLVTNYHVVAEAAEIRVQLPDGRITEPELIGVDRETDLALLRIDLGTVPAVALGTSESLRIGDIVLAIGSPYGLTQSVTQGIVSATGRGLLNLTTFENFIQTDAAINAGNSGGALINTRGELVGINTAVLEQDLSTEGIGFAIPVDLVRGVVNEIQQNGRVIRGWMGLEPATAAVRELMGLERTGGILLDCVYNGGPSESAGLQRGDIILAINGETIDSERRALLIVAGANPGDEVDVSAWRDGERFDATVIAGERPSNLGPCSD